MKPAKRVYTHVPVDQVNALSGEKTGIVQNLCLTSSNGIRPMEDNCDYSEMFENLFMLHDRFDTITALTDKMYSKSSQVFAKPMIKRNV